MNEDNIVKQLSDALPAPAPSQSGYPTPDTQIDPNVNSNFIDKMLPENRLIQMQLMDYLAIPTADRHNPMVDDYINTIYSWARDNAGSGEYNQMLRVINEQEQHMGIKLSSNRLQRLAEYIKISNVRKNLAERERNLYA